MESLALTLSEAALALRAATGSPSDIIHSSESSIQMQSDRRPPSTPPGAVSSLRLQQAAAAALVAETCPKWQPQTSRQYGKYDAQDGGLSTLIASMSSARDRDRPWATCLE